MAKAKFYRVRSTDPVNLHENIDVYFSPTQAAAKTQAREIPTPWEIHEVNTMDLPIRELCIALLSGKDHHWMEGEPVVVTKGRPK